MLAQRLKHASQRRQHHRRPEECDDDSICYCARQHKLTRASRSRIREDIDGGTAGHPVAGAPRHPIRVLELTKCRRGSVLELTLLVPAAGLSAAKEATVPRLLEVKVAGR